MRAVMLFTALVVGVLVVAAIAAPEGEVVTLTTRANGDQEYDTSLWIIEHDGTLFLRAGSPRARWLARLREHPEVRMQRSGEFAYYTAVPVEDASVRAMVNEAMAAKYGFADRAVDRVFDREHSVPIRLEPRMPRPEELARDHGPHP